ncbi:hypothetical protein NQ318_020542 [Aromia moschata]|uniref:Nuclear receptor domain-containing protein n=1 Tax=Aromia moschata TaxID=1265417 RepID=A0AAV8Z0T9_9CUCU|nr:hypothetical protein NQ318_020542 [Aromia moschata]
MDKIFIVSNYTDFPLSVSNSAPLFQSFFGRTYNNINSISVCKNNGECVINKKNRTSCKACRLQKCLVVGMSKSGSRYGRRSNWFKIHCLLQEQQQAGANMAAAAGLLRPHPYLTPFFRNPAAAAPPPPAKPPGASSADPEDDARPASALSYLKTASPASDRDYYPPKKLPSPASDSECFARRKFALHHAPLRVPRLHPVGVAGRRRAQVAAAAAGHRRPGRVARAVAAGGAAAAGRPRPRPGPAHRPVGAVAGRERRRPARRQPEPNLVGGDRELNADVGVDEPVKSVPLDLTLDRQVGDVTN